MPSEIGAPFDRAYAHARPSCRCVFMRKGPGACALAARVRAQPCIQGGGQACAAKVGEKGDSSCRRGGQATQWWWRWTRRCISGP